MHICKNTSSITMAADIPVSYTHLVHTLLEEYHMADYVSYDLGMLSRYQYYTGIIFKAYTYGTGDYIVTGGRYNKLLVQFGKDTPAVGFAIVVDQLMAALSRQQIHIPVQLVNTVILYEPSARQSAVRLSRFFRSEGTPVQAMVMGKLCIRIADFPSCGTR